MVEANRTTASACTANPTRATMRAARREPAAASTISTAPTNMSETTAAAMTANDAPKSTDAP